MIQNQFCSDEGFRSVRLLLTLCVLSALVAVSPAVAQSRAEVKLARDLLTQLQPLSFEKNREYCGWIGVDGDGRLVASKVNQGKRSRCSSEIETDKGIRLIATFHTHGSYLRQYDNEVPSVLDYANERRLKSRGYVSTPGGRFWVVDGIAGEVRLICGPGCLPVDPEHKEAGHGKTPNKLSETQLFRRQGKMPLTIELCGDNLCTD